MFNWSDYIKKTKDRKPRSLLIESLNYVKNKGRSLDLGAGALNDSIFLLQSGFDSVTAIDNFYYIW